MNPQYEAHARLCKSIGDMAKENEDFYWDLANKSQSVEEIYINGGEPTLIKAHFAVQGVNQRQKLQDSLLPLIPELPLFPELPEVPFEPVVPEVPLIPELPELPLFPELPEVPFEPVVPLVPLTPLFPETPLLLKSIPPCPSSPDLVLL